MFIFIQLVSYRSVIDSITHHGSIKKTRCLLELLHLLENAVVSATISLPQLKIIHSFYIFLHIFIRSTFLVLELLRNVQLWQHLYSLLSPGFGILWLMD